MDEFYVPIIIDANNYMHFDPNIVDNNKIILYKGYIDDLQVCRTEEMYILNKNIINILRNLHEEIEESVDSYFRNNENSN